MTGRRFAALAIGLLLIHLPPAAAAPSADLWDRWTAHDPQSAARVDHSVWADFLQRYVHVDPGGVNRVDYSGVTDADRRALDSYLDSLSKVAISSHVRDEQRAFWINLYNALTIDVVLDHYPVDSIRDIDISPGFFADGPWGKKLVTVEGEALSLDDIEHRILRPIWQDPRIHYAVNCASVGCPDLQPQAFTGQNTDAMLTDAARAFVNDPRGVRVEDGEATASRIYDWFEADFGGSERGVLDHLRRYAADALRAKLEGVGDIDSYAYDWSLNDVAR